MLAFLLPKAASGGQFAIAGERRTRWRGQFTDGYRFILRNRMLRRLWFFSTFMGVAGTAATASFVLFVLDTLRVPEARFGVFKLSGAVGGIVGSVIAGRLKTRWGAGVVMATMNLVISVSFFAIGAVPNIAIAAAVVGGDHRVEHPRHVPAAEPDPRLAARSRARTLAHAALGRDAARGARRRASRPHRPHRAVPRRRGECRSLRASSSSGS